jgi:hypothetical protein
MKKLTGLSEFLADSWPWLVTRALVFLAAVCPTNGSGSDRIGLSWQLTRPTATGSHFDAAV